MQLFMVFLTLTLLLAIPTFLGCLIFFLTEVTEPFKNQCISTVANGHLVKHSEFTALLNGEANSFNDEFLEYNTP